MIMDTRRSNKQMSKSDLVTLPKRFGICRANHIVLKIFEIFNFDVVVSNILLS